jgi:hypothetical protein
VAAGAGCDAASVGDAAAGWSAEASAISVSTSSEVGPALTVFRALRDVAAWMPQNAILSAEGAGTMDIGLTQLNVRR